MAAYSPDGGPVTACTSDTDRPPFHTCIAITGSTVVSTQCGSTPGTDLLCDVE